VRRALKIGIMVVSALSACVVAACGPELGPTQTLAVDEPLASAAVTDVRLIMGRGTLSLEPGAMGLLSGTIRYNVEAWEPVIDRGDDRLTVKQKSRDDVGESAGMAINRWQLLLGRAPMRLEITAGDYEGDLDLSGLTLLGLTIKSGAGATDVVFKSANPGQMDRLRCETGESTVSMTGLGNANFKSMEFKGGPGSYSFDFAGQVRTQAKVRITTGKGAVRILVPVGTAASITVKGSGTEVVTEGEWVTKGETHSTPVVGTQGQGKLLSIVLEMAAGTATLVTD